MNQPKDTNYSYISFSGVKKQLFKIWPTVIISSAIALGGAAFTVLISQLTGVPIWKLAKDPAQTLRYQPFIGMLSYWDVLLWMATAVICIFTTSIMKKGNVSLSKQKFIFTSGILSFFIALDDLFVLHDQILPRMLHLPEGFFYLIYIFILLFYLIYFLRQILQYEYILLGIAFLLFATSRRLFIVLPFFDEFLTTGDMLKYFGIVFWLAFFYRAASQEITALIKPEKIS